MVKSFKNSALKKLYETGETRRLPSQHIRQLRDILTALDHSRSQADMAALPGFGLHPLKGNRCGYYAVKVSRNWRVTFRFAEEHAADVDYIDYH